MNKKAFTLAEVLIVLGIIGIVAALSIPTLINNYLKHKTVTRLKAAYTILYQAVTMAEANTGLKASQWDYPSPNDGPSTLSWINKYLVSYLKYTSEGTTVDGAYINLVNGSRFHFWENGTPGKIHVYIGIEDLDNMIPGKNYFIFVIGSGFATDSQASVYPYDFHHSCSEKIGTREYWTCDTTLGCTKSTGKSHCAGLIMYDGWQIASDYPYFN